MILEADDENKTCFQSYQQLFLLLNKMPSATYPSSILHFFNCLLQLPFAASPALNGALSNQDMVLKVGFLDNECAERLLGRGTGKKSLDSAENPMYR